MRSTLINLFQMRDLFELVAISCLSICAMKMTSKATVIFVPIAIVQLVFGIRLPRTKWTS